MTKLIDSFKNNYRQCAAYIRETDGSYDVVERDSSATFKRLTLTSENCKFYGFDNAHIYKNRLYWNKLVATDADKDCDGVVLANKAGDECLCFIELKSNFDTDKLRNAHLQMSYTLLKMMSLFCLCDGFDIESLKVTFVLSCRPFKDKAQEAAVKNILYQSQMMRNNIFLGYLLPNLINSKTKEINIKISKLPLLGTMSLPKGLMNKEIRYKLVLGKDYEDNSVTTIL